MGTFDHICLTDKQLMVHGSDIEYALQRYFYPVVALFGIFGNILNLTVLLNKSMRSRANTFLSMLAFADILFLGLLFPNICANYSVFIFHNTFRWFYFHSKDHLLALANWCSAVAIWCVILVCTDRLVGIRNPLYVRGGWGRGRMPALLTTVILVSGAFTAYQHFEYECLVRDYCNGTQLYSKCMYINNDGSWWGNRTNPYPRSFRVFLSYSSVAFLFTMIICPIVILTILNVMLLCALRRRHQEFAMAGNSSMGDPKRDAHAFHKTEHRVTLTVTCIVTMFTLTNGPSALWHMIRTLYRVDAPAGSMWYNINMLCSTLVICGKASNFILFCLGSKHFRLRLIKLAQRKVHKKMGHLSSRPSSAKMTGILNVIGSITRRLEIVSVMPTKKRSEEGLLKKEELQTPRICSTVPASLVDMMIPTEEEEAGDQDFINQEAFNASVDHYRSRRQSGPSQTSSSPRASASISISTRPRARSSVGSVERPLIIGSDIIFTKIPTAPRKYSEFARPSAL